MRTVTQSHERQQRPVMLDCWVLAMLKANPCFNLGAPRVMEVDNADQRGEHSRRGQGRHVAIIRSVRELQQIESKPCVRLASFKSAGRGGVGGDDGSSAL